MYGRVKLMCKETEIGNRLQQIRIALNLSQEQLAKELEIAQSTISLYEKGLRKPSKSLIKILCSRFNVNQAFIEIGKGPMFNIKFNNDELFRELCMIYNLDEISQAILYEYITMPDNQRKVISSYLKKVTDSIQNNK